MGSGVGGVGGAGRGAGCGADAARVVGAGPAAGAGRGAGCEANALPIAGIIPFSATDWPGKLTATVFVQGCPLACVYCHNSALQAFAPQGGAAIASTQEIAGDGIGDRKLFRDVMDLLRGRHGLLDGLVISGGEPLSSPALPAAIAAAHAEGFQVGLHTSGYAPARLRKLLADDSTRPEWIGLDVKALPEHLPEVAGVSPGGGSRTHVGSHAHRR